MNKSSSHYKDCLRYLVDRDPRLMPATKRLLIRVISHFNLETGFYRKNKNGSTYSAFPTPEYLEFWLDLSPVTVKRSTDEAYLRGWLVKDKDGIECLDLNHLDMIWNLLKEKKETWTRISRKKRRTPEDLKTLERDRKEVVDAYSMKNVSVVLEGVKPTVEEVAPRVEQLEARKRVANGGAIASMLEYDAEEREPNELQRMGEVIELKTGRLH
jgi:hypothetical protein